MLMLGMISARTVNLANVAPERGAMGVAIASTYRRFQRFFQHVRLERVALYRVHPITCNTQHSRPALVLDCLQSE